MPNFTHPHAVNPLLSDAPDLLADLDASTKAINARIPDIAAHLNEAHGYTIPGGLPVTAHGLRRLAQEHAAIHAERVAQEHVR